MTGSSEAGGLEEPVLGVKWDNEGLASDCWSQSLFEDSAWVDSDLSDALSLVPGFRGLLYRFRSCGWYNSPLRLWKPNASAKLDVGGGSVAFAWSVGFFGGSSEGLEASEE